MRLLQDLDGKGKPGASSQVEHRAEAVVRIERTQLGREVGVLASETEELHCVPQLDVPRVPRHRAHLTTLAGDLQNGGPVLRPRFAASVAV